MRRLIFLFILLYLINQSAYASAERIITLSPHLAEWVYSLESGNELIAVSEFSNYPEEAQKLPTVANHLGINLKRIVALEPTIILAWEGGNKAQDIDRLRSLGFEVFTSSPKTINDISKEIRKLAQRLNKSELARHLTSKFEHQMSRIQAGISHKEIPVFYYYWDKPLMTVGPDTWANQLLNHCGAYTLFEDSSVDFPEVNVAEVLKRQPVLLIASSQHPLAQLEQFWQLHRTILDAPLIKVDPDIFSRYTLRLPSELESLCKKIAMELTTD